MLKRTLQNILSGYYFSKRAIIIYGARRVGKTTLLKIIEKQTGKKTIWFYGDTTSAQNLLKPQSRTYLQNLLGDNEVVIVDEAQYIENIDLTAKLIVDFFPEKQLILSGSSSFELANRTTESLTGRKWIFTLYPFSFTELCANFGMATEVETLENRLIYGTYPEVVVNPQKSELILKELHSSYLYKDILMWAKLRKSDKLMRLVKALAYQVGSEVKYRELAQITGLDPMTVERYIDLLEQSFIIFRLMPLSRNLRNELKNTRKIYFYDNGILNAVIDDFRPLNQREDHGRLWENFIVSQMIIQNAYRSHPSRFYFWRTHQKQEIDLIEQRHDGSYIAYEIKWNPRRASERIPKTFVQAYNPKQIHIVHRNNFHEILLALSSGDNI